jgi:hypothetical protein
VLPEHLTVLLSVTAFDTDGFVVEEPPRPDVQDS